MIRLSTVLLLVTSLFIACSNDSEDAGPSQDGITFLNSVANPANLDESSALEVDQDGVFWAANDKGNKAELVGIALDGSIEKEMSFANAMNMDWEELAYEGNTMYIGDFGNNDNDRTDLKIYTIADFTNQGTEDVMVDSISFTFEDQTLFPPAEDNLHFDVEAFFAHDDKLYLFTKDRSIPFEGITKMYTLDQTTGTQIAQLEETYNTSIIEKEGKISSADISPDGTKMFLISEQQLFLFTDFTVPNFFDGNVERFTWDDKRKYEGIVFVDNCALAAINEEKYDVVSKLLNFKICN